MTSGTDETIAAPPDATPAGRDDASLETGAHDRIGRYVVLGRLGAGGMGIVYSAYDPELDRKVAVKVLHTTRRPRPPRRARAKVMEGLFGDEDPERSAPMGVGEQGRLLREAQAAARVNHPNVVTVHDVGEDRGRVFVAMEFVDGKTLTGWLRQDRRPWRAIVAMFLQAAEGLSAAHEQGLVHRDFKPDNVMVDARGRARVMDFGLVRSTGEALQTGDHAPSWNALDVAMTHQGAVMGTPAYMSPEQLRGETVDAAADQFSFCVALWEALYGERPFAGESLPDLVDAVIEGRRAPIPAGARVPAHVRRVLVRGLDSASEARFPTMRALMRALAADPARRRLQIGAVSGILAVGVGVVGVDRIQTRRIEAGCVAQGRELADYWDAGMRAQVERAILDSGLAHAQSLFEKSTPWLDRYVEQWATARAEACRAEARQDDPLASAKIQCLTDRASVFRRFVDSLAEGRPRPIKRAILTAAGLDPVSRCAEPDHLAVHAATPEDPVEAEALRALTKTLGEADALGGEGRPQAGIDTLADADVRADALGYPVLAARIRYLRAAFHEQTGDFDKAERDLLASVHALARAGADEPAAESAARLALITGDRQARAAEGELWAQWAETLLARSGRDSGLAAARVYNELGLLATTRGDFEEALRRHERSLAISEAIEGPSHPSLTTALNNVGTVHSKLGHGDEAMTYYQRALALVDLSLGDDHPDAALPLNNIAKIYWRRGQMGQARDAMERSLALQRASLGEDHPQAALSLGNLGIVVREQGQLPEALTMLERSAEQLRTKLSETHPVYGTALKNLGETRGIMGQHELAEANLRQALSIQTAALGDAHVEVANTKAVLATTLLTRLAYDEAQELLRQAQATYEGAVGPMHPDLAPVFVAQGRLARARGEAEAAVAPLRRAIDVLEAGESGQAAQHEARFELGCALFDSGEDRGGGMAMAKKARAAVSTGAAHSALRARMDDWLAAHTGG